MRTDIWTVQFLPSSFALFFAGKRGALLASLPSISVNELTTTEGKEENKVRGRKRWKSTQRSYSVSEERFNVCGSRRGNRGSGSQGAGEKKTSTQQQQLEMRGLLAYLDCHSFDLRAPLGAEEEGDHCRSSPRPFAQLLFVKRISNRDVHIHYQKD